jgi:hypothetical protein
MFSTAYLTHRDAVRTAGACLLSLAAAHLGAGARPTGDERRAWTATAERWAGGSVPSWAHAIVDAAGRDPIDGAGARESARAAQIDPRLADGLFACAHPGPEGEPSAGVVEAARALTALAPV